MTTPITKFLLVDDDSDDAELFHEAVTEQIPHAKFSTVENGKEVFNVLSRHESQLPDVIFLDINMPVMNGWECLRQLKKDEAYSNIPVIIYSTSAVERDVDLAYNLGAFAFLAKPYHYAELVGILEVMAKTPYDLLLTQLRGFESFKTQRQAG